MEYNSFLNKVQNLPVIDTRVLSAGVADYSSIKVQISRWVKSGKLIQLKRGIYLLPEPYCKVQVSEFYIANILKNPSYISLEKALEYHGLIPEAVNVFTSVTTKRPELLENPLGRFDYRHIKASLFWGYNSIAQNGQTFFMASAEKALLDYFYLKQAVISMDYLKEMRLQNLENIKLRKLSEFAKCFNKKHLSEAVQLLTQFIKDEMKGQKKL